LERSIAWKISREDVLRVAELAYLDLGEAELETYRAQIDEILEYIGKLNELDTSKVEPMAQVLATSRRRTQPCARTWWCRARLPTMCWRMRPIRSRRIFRVPKVIER